MDDINIKIVKELQNTLQQEDESNYDYKFYLLLIPEGKVNDESGTKINDVEYIVSTDTKSYDEENIIELDDNKLEYSYEEYNMFVDLEKSKKFMCSICRDENYEVTKIYCIYCMRYIICNNCFEINKMNILKLQKCPGCSKFTKEVWNNTKNDYKTIDQSESLENPLNLEPIYYRSQYYIPYNNIPMPATSLQEAIRNIGIIFNGR